MATGAGKSDNRYEWQSWPPDSLEGMPPKRRRLAGWAIFWFIILGSLLGSLLGSALEAFGVPEPWRSALLAAVLAAVFVPLIRAAASEARQLRAEGIELPSYPVTRKSLISVGVLTGVLWIAFAVVALSGRPVFPLVPIACTAWLVFQVRRWRKPSADETPTARTYPPDSPS
jgi:MFS family permease